jgi:adenylate kinase
VEFGEALEQALVREVKEEYGFDIEVEGLLDVVNHIIPDEKQHWVSPTFLCRYKGGTPGIREPHKCDEIGWFELDEIPVEKLTIASRKSLESLRRKFTAENAERAEDRKVCDLGGEKVSPMKTSYTLPVDAVLLLGPTGVGKSPLGDAIARQGLLERRARHLDFGVELRAIASGERETGAYTKDELEFIEGVLERGLLLENERFALAEKIIGLFLELNGFRKDHLLVLNGIPRHAGQARDIARIADIRALVVLDCTADDVFCRLRNNVGGDRTDRADDHRELVGKKLDIFRERTAPLVAYYKERGCRIYRLDVTSDMTTEQSYQKLSALAAADPPVALVAEPPQG